MQVVLSGVRCFTFDFAARLAHREMRAGKREVCRKGKEASNWWRDLYGFVKFFDFSCARGGDFVWPVKLRCRYTVRMYTVFMGLFVIT